MSTPALQPHSESRILALRDQRVMLDADLCVGACSNTGSLCSGGIHLRQRVPGC